MNPIVQAQDRLKLLCKVCGSRRPDAFASKCPICGVDYDYAKEYIEVLKGCLERKINAVGYVRDPNNKECWYPGSGGIPAFDSSHTVQVTHDRIRVFTKKLFGEQYTKRTWQDEVTVAVFTTVEEFVAGCPSVSEPGITQDFWD